MDDPNLQDRRPIPARKNRISKDISSFLSGLGISPNAISIASILFAAAAGWCLSATSINNAQIYWVLAPVFIVLRLLANMFDGMVAVETGQTSALGELFNEFPDRISDVVIFIGAGFAAGSNPDLGYIAALMALLVAYVRALGNHMGVSKLFMGPMAKSHRMFTLAALSLFTAFGSGPLNMPQAFNWGLYLIIAGSILTVLFRVRRIISEVGK